MIEYFSEYCKDKKLAEEFYKKKQILYQNSLERILNMKTKRT